MNVKELKEYLSKFPDERLVFVSDWNEEYAKPIEAKDTMIFVDEEYEKEYLKRIAH